MINDWTFQRVIWLPIISIVYTQQHLNSITFYRCRTTKNGWHYWISYMAYADEIHSDSLYFGRFWLRDSPHYIFTIFLSDKYYTFFCYCCFWWKIEIQYYHRKPFEIDSRFSVDRLIQFNWLCKVDDFVMNISAHAKTCCISLKWKKSKSFCTAKIAWVAFMRGKMHSRIYRLLSESNNKVAINIRLLHVAIDAQRVLLHLVLIVSQRDEKSLWCTGDRCKVIGAGQSWQNNLNTNECVCNRVHCTSVYTISFKDELVDTL